MFVIACSDGDRAPELQGRSPFLTIGSMRCPAAERMDFQGAEENHQDWRICFLPRDESLHQRKRHSDGPKKKLTRGWSLLVMLIETGFFGDDAASDSLHVKVGRFTSLPRSAGRNFTTRTTQAPLLLPTSLHVCLSMCSMEWRTTTWLRADRWYHL